jgi:hypothetical protein
MLESTVAIINCPTIERFKEFEMVESSYLRKHNHRIIFMLIRNHTTNAFSSSKSKWQILPEGIMKRKEQKRFRKIKQTQEVIRVSVPEVEENGGMEIWHKFMKKKHPKIQFYPLIIITETIVDNVIYRCTWERRPGYEKGSKGYGDVSTIILTEIDKKEVISNFSEPEMYRIVGSIADGFCRIECGYAPRQRVVCTPVPVIVSK